MKILIVLVILSLFAWVVGKTIKKIGRALPEDDQEAEPVNDESLC